LTDGNRGVARLDCPSSLSCRFKFTANLFENNFASREGGCISWKHFQPILKVNKFYNNNPIYGNETASFPSYIQVKGDSPQV
jgi:hypothetical protein